MRAGGCCIPQNPSYCGLVPRKLRDTRSQFPLVCDRVELGCVGLDGAF